MIETALGKKKKEKNNKQMQTNIRTICSIFYPFNNVYLFSSGWQTSLKKLSIYPYIKSVVPWVASLEAWVSETL